MASSKERQRWERWYSDVEARMERQKNSITRLVAISTEAMAALESISQAGMAGNDDCRSVSAAPDRAQLALDRIKGSAAASVLETAPLIDQESPVTDPRRATHED